MASIQSLGIGSGILTSEFLDDIIEAEGAASNLRLDFEQERVEAQISAYGEIKSAVDKLASSVSALSLESAINNVDAKSSDEDSFTASTNSTASTGSYTVKVDQIATSHSLATKQYASVNDTIGTGTLSFKFGEFTFDGSDNITAFSENEDTTAFSITVDSSNNTLAGLRDAINNLDAGVTASVVNDGTAFRLLFTSEESGAEYQMEISASGDAALQNLAYNQAQQDPTANMEMTQKGQNAELEINGLAITSKDNSIDEVIKGVSVNITGDTGGAIRTLNITRDTEGVVSKVETMLEAYNEYRTIYKAASDFNATEEIGGVLLGDSTLRTVNSQIRSTLVGIVEGISGEKYRSLADIGIYTDQNDDFFYKINSEKLTAALNDEAEVVTKLFASGKESSDPFVEFFYTTSDTEPGDYAIEITQLASQAKLFGQTGAGFDFTVPVSIGDSADSLNLTIDGTTATVELTHGSYATGSELAEMIQSSINGDDTFANKGKSVSVFYNDTDKRLELTSSTYGSSSSLSINSVDTTLATLTGLGTAGQGAISGNYFSSLSEQSFAASTSPGSIEITDSGINFDTNNISFDLEITNTTNDGTYNITLDENWADVTDTDGVITNDRTIDEVLTYIQSEVDTAIGATGVVTAELNSANRLVFRTNPTSGSTQTIELTNYVVAATDVLGLDDSAGVQSSGVTVDPGAEFELTYTNRLGSVTTGTIAVPDTVYETGEDLATAIQTAINADAAVLAGAQPATTTTGSVDLSGEDFTSEEFGFAFDFNGTSFEVVANTTPAGDTNGDGNTDNMDAIQDAINIALLAGGEAANSVIANNSSGNLFLTTANTGSAQSIDLTSDGRGAYTTSGTQVLAAGIDFSSDNATVGLIVDGETINFTIDGDGSTSVEATVGVIQNALDTALAAYNGGGEFAAGDVVAKLDSSNQLYFETVSKDGVATNATFGALASIEIASFTDTVGGDLGLLTDGVHQNGYNAAGLDTGIFYGFDSQATVEYQQDEDDYGRFSISFGADTTITVDSASLVAAVQLGVNTDNTTESPIEGSDVAGTINGVQASGTGQILRAGDGSNAATNGYILGGPGADFTSAVTIDATNNTLTIEVDGIESGTITLTNGAYNTGEALANELENKINADSNLTAEGVSVDVQYDADTAIFGIFSVSKGSNSTVDIKEITNDGSTIFGLSSSTQGVDGKDLSGQLDAAKGVQIKVTGGSTGDRGTISYVEGIATTLSDLLDNYLDAGGSIYNRIEALEDQAEEIETERTTVETRLETRRAQMAAQFAYYDRIISTMNTTEDYLVQQFKALSGSNDD